MYLECRQTGLLRHFSNQSPHLDENSFDSRLDLLTHTLIFTLQYAPSAWTEIPPTAMSQFVCGRTSKEVSTSVRSFMGTSKMLLVINPRGTLCFWLKCLAVSRANTRQVLTGLAITFAFATGLDELYMHLSVMLLTIPCSSWEPAFVCFKYAIFFFAPTKTKKWKLNSIITPGSKPINS